MLKKGSLSSIFVKNTMMYFIYLDDIVIFGETLQIHNEKLREVLNRMRKYNLKLQPDKCEFLRKKYPTQATSLQEMALNLMKERLKREKLSCTNNYSEIKEFSRIGRIYRRFIPNFISKIAKPLTELLKNNTPYVWNEKTEIAFNALKEFFSTEPLLQYPDFKKPFVNYRCQ
jgi:hypothetical protein